MPVQIKQPHIQKHIFYLIDNAPNNGQVISKAGPYTGKIGLIEWSDLSSPLKFPAAQVLQVEI